MLGVTLGFVAAQAWAGGGYTSSGNQVNANIKTDDGGTAPIFDVVFPSGFIPTGGTCGTGCTVQTGANGNPSDIEFFLSYPAASINALITLNSPFSCTSGNTITDRISRDRSTYIALAPLTCSQPGVTPPPPPPPPKNCDSERAAVAAAAARVGALQAAIDVFRATEIQPTLDKLNDAIERTVKLAKQVSDMPLIAPFNTRGVVQGDMEKAQAEMEALRAKLQELGGKLRNLRDALRRAQKDLDAALKALDACLASADRLSTVQPWPAGATLLTACTAELKALAAAGARRAAYRELARIAPASSLRQASNGLADASRQLQALATVLAADGPKEATALANTRAILGLTRSVGTVASRVASAAASIRAKLAASGRDVVAAKAALAKCQGTPPQKVSISEDDTWAYNPAIGKSNICINVRTTPAQASVSATLDGPSGYHARLDKTQLNGGGTIQIKSGIRQAGDYTKTLTVYDASGKETATVTTTFTVAPPPQDGPATNPPCPRPTQ